MALDKNDLKQIRNIVRDEVHNQITAEVPPIIEAKILPVKQKVEQIWNCLNEDLVSNLTMIEKLSKKVKVLEARVQKLELAK